jgi:uncharacterized RDD family membrane protein YckC
MNRNHSPRAALLAALFLPIVIGIKLHAEDAAAPTPTAAVAPAVAKPADAPKDAVAAPAAPAVTPAPAEAPLHEIGAAPAKADKADKPEKPDMPEKAERPEAMETVTTEWSHNGMDSVSIGDPNEVKEGETVQQNAVAVMGPLVVNGTVNQNAVAVMGTNTVNGHVHGNAVAVLGDLTLGPSAVIDGDAVSVGGHVHKSAGAKVRGQVVPVHIGIAVSDGTADTTMAYYHHCLKLFRPLAFGAHLAFLWIFGMGLALFSLALVAIFPAGINRCTQTLARRPVITLLTGFLSLIGLPLLFVLLCATVVGIPVALLLLPLGTLACLLFGKAAVQTFVGQSIVGHGSRPLLAAAVGILVLTALYLVPFLGFILMLFVSFLGFSLALTTLLMGDPNAKPPAPVVPVPAAPAPSAVPAPGPVVAPLAALEPEAAAAAGLDAPQPPSVAAAVPAPIPVPPVVGAGLPRAGFWVRIAALLIDTALIAVVVHFPPLFLVALAAYGAVLWKLRGSTIGGMIFHLQVLRTDGRPMDWTSSIVRSLGCFLSCIFIGLGFLWIAFDPEKQAWHDKIAGTIVVKGTKSIPLV